MVKFNTDPSFVGLELLKRTHGHQIDEFEAWAAQNAWENFHHNHYDWWAFPIDQPSSYGFKWVVYNGEIANLKAEVQFMQKYQRGLVLLSASWGWDLLRAELIPNSRPEQSWQNWPIRLYKAAYSAQLFGQNNSFSSFQKYAISLKEKGESFLYNGRDLGQLFMR